MHAKVLIVDDCLLKIGSSNLNNRSMGLDTECDLAVEAVPGHATDRAVAAEILGLRDALLGEHLGVPPDDIARTLARSFEKRGDLALLPAPAWASDESDIDANSVSAPFFRLS